MIAGSGGTTVRIGGRSGATILRSSSRNASTFEKFSSSSAYSARTSAALRRDGLRSRHAFVLQRGVQYFRVVRVSGNRLPQYSQVPITPSHVRGSQFAVRRTVNQPHFRLINGRSQYIDDL